MDGRQLREALFQVIADYSERGSEFQSRTIIREAAQKLEIRGCGPLAQEQALLTFFHDLFRTGYLAWGHDLRNSDPPFLHLTEQGRLALAQFSRDPANPDGYLEYVLARGLNSIAESYLREALAAFNSGLSKAAAVMTGVASEALVLEVRDCLAARMDQSGQAKPPDLEKWIVRRVLGAIEQALEPRKKDMPRPLKEEFEAYWPALVQQVRSIRNEAGHPISVDPVEPETVHASLLLFPKLAQLARDLTGWIQQSY
jgi:hypothetical protein